MGVSFVKAFVSGRELAESELSILRAVVWVSLHSCGAHLWLVISARHRDFSPPKWLEPHAGHQKNRQG